MPVKLNRKPTELRDGKMQLGGMLCKGFLGQESLPGTRWSSLEAGKSLEKGIFKLAYS